jgi:hypothetical protein
MVEKSGLYFGGIPTGPDVQALMDLMDLAEWKQGSVLSYEAIESALKMKRRTYRFRTVVSVWRKKILREKLIDTEAVTNEGIKWLEEPERVGVSVRDHGRHVRGQGRALRRISLVRTEKLTEEQRRTADHARRLMETSFASARSSAKEIASVFAPTKSTLRLK